jgi:hypothetical protein
MFAVAAGQQLAGHAIVAFPVDKVIVGGTEYV